MLPDSFMVYHPAFDSAQNQALLVVCARKTIRTAANAGIIWGAINLAIGFFLVQQNPLNAGILALGLLMLGAGLTARRRPSLGALLSESIVSLFLFFWNVGIAIINVRAGYADHIEPHGLIVPAIAAAIFFQQYKKLGHLKEAIAAMDQTTVQEASGLCRDLFKSKLKESPDVAEASSRRCRLRLMSDSVFCAQKNLARAFHMDRENLRRCIPNPGKKRVRLVVRHPLGKLTYAFDRKNSEKIKSWLGVTAASAS